MVNKTRSNRLKGESAEVDVDAETRDGVDKMKKSSERDGAWCKKVMCFWR